MLRILERKDELHIKNYFGYLKVTVKNRSLNYIRDTKHKREVQFNDYEDYFSGEIKEDKNEIPND